MTPLTYSRYINILLFLIGIILIIGLVFWAGPQNIYGKLINTRVEFFFDFPYSHNIGNVLTDNENFIIKPSF